MPPPKTRPASLFQGQPGNGWTPTRKRPALQRELTGEPPEAKDDAKDGVKDDAAPIEQPATGIASHGSASSRKI